MDVSNFDSSFTKEALPSLYKKCIVHANIMQFLHEYSIYFEASLLESANGKKNHAIDLKNSGDDAFLGFSYIHSYAGHRTVF